MSKQPAIGQGFEESAVSPETQTDLICDHARILRGGVASVSDLFSVWRPVKCLVN
jgi:hypothetical protein